MMIRTIALTLAALAATPATATVSASNPQSVITALQNAGYKAVLEKDRDGDPTIKTSMSGLRVQILFYGCTEHANCRTLQFNSGFDLKEAIPLEKLNEWSKANRWLTVYRDDEGDPITQMDVMVGPGGLPDQTFSDAVAVYEQAIGSFARFIGF